MELPEDFFQADDAEVLTPILANMAAFQELFLEGGTTEALRMSAAGFRVVADRLELIALRVEAAA